jgi:hypothetical protein
LQQWATINEQLRKEAESQRSLAVWPFGHGQFLTYHRGRRRDAVSFMRHPPKVFFGFWDLTQNRLPNVKRLHSFPDLLPLNSRQEGSSNQPREEKETKPLLCIRHGDSLCL